MVDENFSRALHFEVCTLNDTWKIWHGGHDEKNNRLLTKARLQKVGQFLVRVGSKYSPFAFRVSRFAIFFYCQTFSKSFAIAKRIRTSGCGCG
jgi:hypothetical protein